MSHWRNTMVISNCQLAFLSILSRWQLIQNSAPSTIVWRQCEIRLPAFHLLAAVNEKFFNVSKCNKVRLYFTQFLCNYLFFIQEISIWKKFVTHSNGTIWISYCCEYLPVSFWSTCRPFQIGFDSILDAYILLPSDQKIYFEFVHPLIILTLRYLF